MAYWEVEFAHVARTVSLTASHVRYNRKVPMFSLCLPIVQIVSPVNEMFREKESVDLRRTGAPGSAGETRTASNSNTPENEKIIVKSL